nr:hypothetical protein CFP56_76099 [Quercus suber]
MFPLTERPTFAMVNELYNVSFFILPVLFLLAGTTRLRFLSPTHHRLQGLRHHQQASPSAGAAHRHRNPGSISNLAGKTPQSFRKLLQFLQQMACQVRRY